MFIFKLMYKLFKHTRRSWHQFFNVAWLDNLLFKRCFIWEPKVSRFVSKQKGNVFVDVGACYGRYVILAAKRFNHVIAVEPLPRNMETVRRNVKYAGLSNVEFVECAVSDKRDYANLRLVDGDGLHRLIASKQNDTVMVKTETLQSLLQSRIADLVKVDVEGYEWQVLKGAETVVGNIKHWIVELHEFDRKAELEQWFASHGYSTKWLDDSHIYAF